MATDAFFSSGKAHLLGGGRLDVDLGAVNLTGRAQGRLHDIHIGRQLRGLADDCNIGIGNGKSFGEDKLHDLFQQGNGVNILETLIRVRKMTADITSGKGAKDGITEGVSDHVGIGVPGESLAVRNFYAGKDEIPVRDKAMGVVAVADTQGGGGGWLHNFFRQDQVQGAGDFDIGLRAFNEGDGYACLFQQGRLVGDILVGKCRVGLFEQGESRRLRGLGLPEILAVDGAGNGLVWPGLFQGIFYRDGGDGRAMFPGGFKAVLDKLRGDQGPGSIMHKNNVDVVV